MSQPEKLKSVIRGEEERHYLVSEYEASSMTMGIREEAPIASNGRSVRFELDFVVTGTLLSNPFLPHSTSERGVATVIGRLQSGCPEMKSAMGIMGLHK